MIRDTELRIVVQELDAQVPRTVLNEPGQELGGGLGHGVEEGIAAADVGLERVEHAHPVAQLDVVMVARTAAVRLVGARGEEGTVDAMLHVKHGNLLMDHDLEPVGRDGVDQIDELAGVQVVRGRHAGTAPSPEQVDG